VLSFDLKHLRAQKTAKTTSKKLQLYLKNNYNDACAHNKIDKKENHFSKVHCR